MQFELVVGYDCLLARRRGQTNSIPVFSNIGCMLESTQLDRGYMTRRGSNYVIGVSKHNPTTTVLSVAHELGHVNLIRQRRFSLDRYKARVGIPRVFQSLVKFVSDPDWRRTVLCATKIEPLFRKWQQELVTHVPTENRQQIVDHELEAWSVGIRLMRNSQLCKTSILQDISPTRLEEYVEGSVLAYRLFFATLGQLEQTLDFKEKEPIHERRY